MAKQLSRIANQVGLSLIEIMIGLAILMIGGSAFMLFSEQTSQANRYSRAVSSNNDLIAEIKMALDSETGCTSNFRTINLGKDEGDKKDVDIWAVDNKDPVNPIRVRKVASINPPENRYSNTINIVKSQLEVVSVLPDDQFLLKLVIATDLTGKVLGPRSMVTQIPILAVNGADGFTCRGGFQYGGMVNVDSILCRLESGGELTYDPVKRTCVKVPCVDGPDANTATCTVGTARICSTNGVYASGAAPVIPRTYQNGATISRGPPDFIWDISPDGKTCTCTYAAEITISPGTRCQACCGD